MWDVESSSGEEIREGSKGSSLVLFSGGVDVLRLHLPSVNF